MSTEMLTREATNGNAPVAPVEIYRPASPIVDFSPAQIQLVKRTICKPKNREATNDELSLFIGQCKRTGLDPFAQQIYAIFRWDSQSRDERMSIQTGIDGLRLIAERPGTYLGQDGPWWCGPDGVWTETWFKDGQPAAAKAVVKKLIGGVIAETPAVAHFREYVPMRNGKPMGRWGEMPANMIAKCAEALALRKAFPNDMSGLVTDAEMDRQDARVVTAAAEAIPENRLRVAPADALDPVKAKRLADLTETVGVIDKAQRVIARFTREDPGPLADADAVAAALAGLPDDTLARYEAWLNEMADEAAS